MKKYIIKIPISYLYRLCQILLPKPLPYDLVSVLREPLQELSSDQLLFFLHVVFSGPMRQIMLI